MSLLKRNNKSKNNNKYVKCHRYEKSLKILKWVIRKRESKKGLWLGLQCLTPLSTLVQSYRGGQIYWWRKPEYAEKTTNLTNFLSHIVVSSTPRMSGIRTHNVTGDMH